MADRSPDVSVVIAVHNGMPYIERTLESVLAQTIGLARMQVLIVDDGSTDGTSELADRVAADHAFEVFHQENSGGPAGPRNFALEHVVGRYVFFLDADDYLSDDALAAMVEAADAHGTDVVAGRIKGLGGRRTPRWVFMRPAPRTDVFTSRAYGSLNPMKLFRTEMIRRLGLRFRVDLPWGEDQPFTASAYLGGGGISVLTGKDYVFWRYREDRSNMTTRLVSLAERMPVAGVMFDLVADKVPPGPARDRLMARHFRSELLNSAFEGYRAEGDPVARATAFARFAEIAHAYYNERVEAALPPAARVLLRLVSEGRAGEFGEYLDLLAAAGMPGVLARGEGLFLELPWFGDADRGLPDALFEIGARLRAWCRTEPMTLQRVGLHVSASCGLGAMSHLISGVSLVVRSADGGARQEVPLAFSTVVEEGQAVALVDDVAGLAGLIGGMPAGTFGLYLRVSAGERWRESRVVECAAPGPRLRIARLKGPGGRAKTAILITTKKGNLSLRVVDGAMTEWGYRIEQYRKRLRRRAGRLVRALLGR